MVHRLDQPVDGLLVFGKRKETAACLTAQLGDSGLEKTYLALVLGKPAPAEGELRNLHKKEGGIARIRPEAFSGKPSGEWKPAVLSYRTNAMPKALHNKAVPSPEGLPENFSEVTVRLRTGRFHQIRAQFAAAGHPLLGDRKYGNEACKALAEHLGIRTVCLCANTLRFQHPATGEAMSFEVRPIWEETP